MASIDVASTRVHKNPASIRKCVFALIVHSSDGYVDSSPADLDLVTKWGSIRLKRSKGFFDSWCAGDAHAVQRVDLTRYPQ